MIKESLWFQKYLAAADFLQNVVYINIPMTDDEKVFILVQLMSWIVCIIHMQQKIMLFIMLQFHHIVLICNLFKVDILNDIILVLSCNKIFFYFCSSHAGRYFHQVALKLLYSSVSDPEVCSAGPTLWTARHAAQGRLLQAYLCHAKCGPNQP